MRAKTKSKLTLAALGLFFFGPLVIAGYLYSTRDNWVPNTTNRGVLLEAPVHIDEVGLDLHLGSWYLLYLADNKCEDICKKNLYTMRQVRVAMGAEKNRVQRVIASVGKLEEINSLINFAFEGTKHIQITQAINDNRIKLDHLFIVDPHGNIMMRYDKENTDRDVYKDLKHLLKVSKIG